MARRGLSSAELKKKRDEKFNKLKSDRSGVKYEQNRKNKGSGGGTTTTTTKKMTGKERAQAMAKKRIAAGKSIADVKAANKLKIKKKAAEKYAAFKKKKKK